MYLFTAPNLFSPRQSDSVANPILRRRMFVGIHTIVLPILILDKYLLLFKRWTSWGQTHDVRLRAFSTYSDSNIVDRNWKTSLATPFSRHRFSSLYVRYWINQLSHNWTFSSSCRRIPVCVRNWAPDVTFVTCLYLPIRGCLDKGVVPSTPRDSRPDWHLLSKSTCSSLGLTSSSDCPDVAPESIISSTIGSDNDGVCGRGSRTAVGCTVPGGVSVGFSKGSPENTIRFISPSISAIVKYAYHAPAIAKAAVVKKNNKSIIQIFSVGQILLMGAVAISKNSDVMLRITSGEEDATWYDVFSDNKRKIPAKINPHGRIQWLEPPYTKVPAIVPSVPPINTGAETNVWTTSSPDGHYLLLFYHQW